MKINSYVCLFSISTVDTYRLQHCLKWVVRVYTIKLTPVSVVTYLFHDCERSHSVIVLPSVARLYVSLRWSKHYTHSTVLASGVLPCSARSFASCFDLFLSHFAGFHVANRAVTLLLLPLICMKSFSAFCSEYSRARPSTAWMCRSFYDAPYVYLADQLCALNRDCCSDC